MRIKQQDEQRLVMAPTLGERLFELVALAALIVLSIRYPSPWLVALGVLVGFHSLGKLVGNRVVIDKPAETIRVEERPFLLIHRQRVVRFSDVSKVAVDYREETWGGRDELRMDAWKVSVRQP